MAEFEYQVSHEFGPENSLTLRTRTYHQNRILSTKTENFPNGVDQARKKLYQKKTNAVIFGMLGERMNLIGGNVLAFAATSNLLNSILGQDIVTWNSPDPKVPYVAFAACLGSYYIGGLVLAVSSMFDRRIDSRIEAVGRAEAELRGR